MAGIDGLASIATGGISSILNIGLSIIDKLIPDPVEKQEKQIELLNLENQGKLEEMKLQLSAIIAEAQSPDPWTSRARPSFLYVMYIMILMAIPMGIISVFSADIAKAMSDGMKAYLDAIPSALWGLFGTGYLGYAVTRTWDKKIAADTK